MALYQKQFDVIVVGAGHAGCEAGLACAKLGLETLVLCLNLDTVAAMSCNPAIGGLAKGHLVREIDALGGMMGLAADHNGIQFKMLNTRRGPAVQAPRAQCDKKAYQSWVKTYLENQQRLSLKQGQVEKIIVEDGQAKGVLTKTGTEYRGKAIIITTGTFLQGLIHIGDHRIKSGRSGEHASYGLSDNLRDLGFELGRLKTGTNPRVDGKTLDLTSMSEAPGDALPRRFSHRSENILENKVICWTVDTNEAVHQAIRDAIPESPLYNGTIKGIGPRYCPSIEDKVTRFPDKLSHQIFVEPEGIHTHEMYLNGLSTSLPEEYQLRFLRQIKGFEKVEIMRPGYAVEYDFVPPTQLRPTLETRKISSLYLAGQINGTSGYEEAAAQGLMAGINAARKIKGEAPVVLERSQAYIGVLIDDLITKGTSEPYRLFTSLAEYRLLLRADNADLRLMDIGFDIGLLEKQPHSDFSIRRETFEKELKRLKTLRVNPTDDTNAILKSLNSSPLVNDQAADLYSLLRRPELNYFMLAQLHEGIDKEMNQAVAEQVEIHIKYEGYITRQLMQVEQFKKLERKALDENMDFENIRGLKTQAREVLKKLRPVSVGQASRLPGVTPADISVLLVALEASKTTQKSTIS